MSKQKQRKALYTGEQKIIPFLRWVCDDFLVELDSIKSTQLFISVELAASICKNMTNTFQEQFIYINKGPKQDINLSGLVVVYNG